MPDVFPEPILNLPQADIPIAGTTAFLSQGADHQLLFMQFSQDVLLPEHAHADQWGIVLEGQIELCIGGDVRTYQKGDRYYIPAGVTHAGKIFAGYADITFFGQKDRYPVKQG